jgi:hypothetical protein
MEGTGSGRQPSGINVNSYKKYINLSSKKNNNAAYNTTLTGNSGGNTPHDRQNQD